MALLLRKALADFGASITQSFAVAGAVPAQPESQLTAPVVNFLSAIGAAISRDIVPRPEAHASEYGVRPDIGVSVDKLLTGHVELKAPGKGARGKDFTDEHDKAQFKRLADHPNLIYTDGNEWALYRKGEIIGSVVVAAVDVREGGAAAYSDEQCIALETLLRDFVSWHPLVPSSPKALAELLAPLTRLLREAVVVALGDPESSVRKLASEWRGIFFPDAGDAQFADAYAQTVTYALLLARVEGEHELRDHAADMLDARHELLAEVLRILAQAKARAEVDVPISLLERAIEAVDPAELEKKAKGRDIWLHFYEDFLAAYDNKLRKQRGVYYTPVQVVEAQVRLVDELLREQFDLDLGFADPSVVALDPAVGTGTYLLAALEHGAETALHVLGKGGRSERASIMARNLHGFELLVGPYAVAQLRIAQRVLGLGGEIPAEGLPVLLTDTLESPFAAPQGAAHAPLFEKRLADENARARKVKATTSVIVCLGNPPYFRQVIEAKDVGSVDRQGGWVREGDGGKGEVPIFADFLRDAPPLDAKNLYNLYVYFWRWALWKVFESDGGRRSGVISFITASSYLRGPGFAGMRRHMRELFDELWIIDLGGEGRGARRSENVFAIQTPVAIALGYRSEGSLRTVPAKVRYAVVEGTREQKLAALEAVTSVDDFEWHDCFDGWTQPFLPERSGDFFAWPKLTDMFPWQHSGVQFKRKWPIGPDRATLGDRWTALVAVEAGEAKEQWEERRRVRFHESRDRKIDRSYPDLAKPETSLPPLATLAAGSPPRAVARYGYRSFDRQFCLADNRVGDFLRPALWKTLGPRQLFMTSLLTGLLGEGQAATVTHLIPDMDHFRGSFGAKHVVPLFRDAACATPNITGGLLDLVAAAVGMSLKPEDLFAYCYGILAAPSYCERFFQELEIPGPRIPLTADAPLWKRMVAAGRELIWLHTFGERLVPSGARAGRVPQGSARCTKTVPQRADAYPEQHELVGTDLRVGEGVFSPVPEAVYSFSVSGFAVVKSWLDYRMKKGAGKQSSELDKRRAALWPPAYTHELLELLWVIERTLALQPELDALLGEIVGGDLIPASALPEPTDAERTAP